MKYTKEELKGKVKFTVTITKEEFEKEVQKAYEAHKNEFKAPGFRKGKVPRKVIEGMYGEGVFFEDAINEAINEFYPQVLDQEKEVYPIDNPKCDVSDLKDGLTFTAEVEVLPEVKLGEYKDLTIKKIEHKIEDKDVEEDLKQTAERTARLINVSDREARNGDDVIIDFSGSIDGVKFDGGTAEKQSLVLGSNTFIPGFEDQVVGMKIDEEKDINVKFPEDYAEDLKGKDAVFHIKLHEIRVKEIPEINDEFAKDVSEFDNLNEYKIDIKNKLQESADKKAETEMENNLVDAIVEKTEVDIPEVLVERQVDSMIKEMEYRLMYSGMKLDDYLKYTKQELKDLKAQYREEAKKQVKVQLTIDAIVKKEKIEPTKEEMEEKIAELAKQAEQTVEQYKEHIKDRQFNYLYNEITTNKLFKFLKEANKFE